MGIDVMLDHVMIDTNEVCGIFLTEGINLHILFKNGCEKGLAYANQEEARKAFDFLKQAVMS